MSLVSAIKSFLTPTKYYYGKNVTVAKKLQCDGSTLVQSFDRKGTLLKTITTYPIDEFFYNNIHGNSAKKGHITVVNNIYNGTVTTIKKISTKYEKPMYDALEHNAVLVGAGESIKHFDKVTKRGKNIVGKTFHMTEYPYLRKYSISHFNSKGEPTYAQKTKIAK